jgi:hypothetical protein
MKVKEFTKTDQDDQCLGENHICDQNPLLLAKQKHVFILSTSYLIVNMIIFI